MWELIGTIESAGLAAGIWRRGRSEYGYAGKCGGAMEEPTAASAATESQCRQQAAAWLAERAVE